MNFENCIKEGNAKVVLPNKIRAASLFVSSTQAVQTAKTIFLDINSAKSVFRELYEGLREHCEAVGLLKGYKFLDHESITYFLKDVLKEEGLSYKFDRYRKLRNEINYYGNDIKLETVKEAIADIPKLMMQLNKYK